MKHLGSVLARVMRPKGLEVRSEPKPLNTHAKTGSES